MRRSLIYFWRINLAVVLGGAVATAVLTGALFVGDSVRGSLRDLTLERLGEIDYALVTHRFFREEMLVELAVRPEIEREFTAMASAIFTNASAVHSNTKARASGINLYAVDEQFFAFYDNASQDGKSVASSLHKASGQVFPSIVINQSVQDQLQAEIGDQVVLSFEKPSDIARGSLLGSRDTEDVVETARFTLTEIIPDRGPGRFSLQPNQNRSLNAFVSLPVLQRELDRKDRVNAILVSQKSAAEQTDLTSLLMAHLQQILTLEDLELGYEVLGDVFSLESNESILSPQVVSHVNAIAQELQTPALASYVYLANRMQVDDRVMPYSTVAALNTAVGPPFKTLSLVNGQQAPKLSANEILLNKWAADDLRVRSGDKLRMTYFGVGPRDDLYTEESVFEVVGVVAMQGLAADPELTPDFPGIADADNMADWDPPFPVDLSLIRPKDEDYWDRYRGTPKAFVAEETGRQLWGSRFGSVTTMRIAPAPGSDVTSTLERFEEKLLERVQPQEFNLTFQAVKKQGLASSTGAINFAEYFVYFSFFLIVSAGLLVGLLFRLSVEQRASEIGMLLSLGYPVRKVRWQFLSEGTLLAIIGSLVGLGGAILYAWILMVGLRTWWLAAVGTPFLYLHVTPLSFIIGFAGSILIIIVSIWLGFRRISKIPPPALLAGATTISRHKGVSIRAKMTAGSAVVLATVLTLLSFFLQGEGDVGLFFGVGTLLLVAGLSFFSIWLRSKHRMITRQSGLLTWLRMAARNSPRSPGRSMLSAALVGCACFVIIAVESFRRDFGEELLQKDSGAGGFALVAEADVPLHQDLSTEDGRIDLGFSDNDSEALDDAEIIPFRLQPGQDASCLNLYQVEKPRILGVTETLIERGGFRFQSVADFETNGQSNPWTLLEMELEPNVIPAFGDQNSVKYILHSGLGKDFELTNEFGVQVKLRFVGLLTKSIFQSEILISEDHFLKHFPSQTGYSYFLVQPLSGRLQETTRILESSLADYGLDVVTTAERLSAFQAVENTYLSTFQALGGLGLILGTVGLGIILIRNVIERRGELATLRAFGYRSRSLAGLVLGENGFLLVLGVLIGGVSAIIAVSPHLLGGASEFPLRSLMSTLLIVFVVGMLASAAAVRAALRIPLLPALKAE